jgi:hypothetical protein
VENKANKSRIDSKSQQVYKEGVPSLRLRAEKYHDPRATRPSLGLGARSMPWPVDKKPSSVSMIIRATSTFAK